MADTKELIPSIIATTLFMGLIYGAYFMATYFESKNIIYYSWYKYTSIRTINFIAFV